MPLQGNRKLVAEGGGCSSLHVLYELGRVGAQNQASFGGPREDASPALAGYLDVPFPARGERNHTPLAKKEGSCWRTSQTGSSGANFDNRSSLVSYTATITCEKFLAYLSSYNL